MAQPLLWGKDLERDLMDYMEQHQGEFYRGGGMAKSDTVPAMLTPGEYVVNKDAVSRYGAGFFESINNLRPGASPGRRALVGIQGFASGGLVQSRRFARWPDLCWPPTPGPAARCGWSWPRETARSAPRSMRATNRAFCNFLTLPEPARFESIPMQLKNLSNEVALPLPDDLLWSDEHAWTPAVATVSYLITGALLIQSATRQAGRPITLVGAPDMAWVTRASGRAAARLGRDSRQQHHGPLRA